MLQNFTSELACLLGMKRATNLGHDYRSVHRNGSLHSWLGGSTYAAEALHRYRTHLQVEELESRATPAVLLVKGPLDAALVAEPTSSLLAAASPAVSSLQIITPNNVTAGAPFSVTVKAKDNHGNIVAGDNGPITLTSSDGQPLQTQPTNITLAGGVATFSVTLDKAGSTSLAVLAGTVKANSNKITIASAAATSLAITVPTIVTAGSSFKVTITAKDPFGNIATAVNGPVTLTSSDGQTIFGLPSKINLAKGVANLNVTLDRAGVIQLKATGAGFVAQSVSITVNAGLASTLLVGAPSAATAGAAFTVNITADDKFGNLVTSLNGPITLTASDGQTVIQSAGPVTLNGGVGSATVSLDREDTLTLHATNGHVSGASGKIAIAAGAPASFAISAPSNVTAGQYFDVAVRATDAFGNLVTTNSDQLVITSSDGQNVNTKPGLVTLANNGAKFQAMMYIAGNTTLTVLDPVDNAKGTSNTITISPWYFCRFDVEAPSEVVTGKPFTVTILAADDFANPVTTFSGPVTLSTFDYSQVMTVSPSPIIMNHGVATATVTMNTADVTMLFASTGRDGAIWGESSMMTVVSTAPISLSVAAPSTVTAGLSFDVTVSGVDALGEIAKIDPSSVTLTAADGQSINATPIGSQPDGSAVFSVTMDNADVTTLSAAVSGILPGTSSAITIQGGAATKLVVNAPDLAVAGIGLPVTITAEDQFGNIAAGFNGPATLAASDGQSLTYSSNPINVTNGTVTVFVTMNTEDSLTLHATVNSFSATSGTITVGTPDWFSANLSDLVVQAYARADFARDGAITFSDMTGLLNAVAAESPTITASELQTLQELVSPTVATYLNMPGYVQNLADKVINGDAANAQYQGSTLGDLHVGSASTQLQDLVNKWFLGMDRPAIGNNAYSWTWGAFPGTNYQPVSGNLFGAGGPHFQDVKMGWSDGGFYQDWSSSAVGGFNYQPTGMYEWNVDSSLMASLEEIAARDPALIQSMFIDDGVVTVNGQSEHLWTVRFYNNGTPEYVTVDNELPLWQNIFYYANGYEYNIPSSNVLWVALAEKALAQLAASGWTGLPDANAYQSLDDMYVHGNSALILPLLTGGQQMPVNNFSTAASLGNAFESGNLITLLSSPYSYLPADMDYSVIGYDSTSQMFTLLSPWGANSGVYTGWPDQFQMSWSDLQANFYVDGNCVPGDLAATSIQVSAPLQATTGTSFEVMLTALDKNGNTASGFNGPVTLTASDGQSLNVTPSTVTLFNGTATVTVTLDTADTLTINASAAGIGGSSGDIQVADGVTDWFAQNLSDLGLQDVARADFVRDGSITYRDMLDLFSEAESESPTVTAAEMQSLQAMVTPKGSAFLNMTSDVQNLAFKVIDGDAANAVYQSMALGNLSVGDSSAQLQLLVNKWFLGMDLPTTTDGAIYTLVNGTLFGAGGPTYKDVYQGEIGDCWLMASLAETATRDPAIIQSMFIYDGTAVENGQTAQIWTVRFYDNGTPEYVTVNNLLPEVSGQFYYANFQQNINNPGSVLWVALAEKAYAELCGSGWTDQAPINSYESLAGGWGSLALPVITGGVQSSTPGFVYNSDYVPLANAFMAGNLITLATSPVYDYVVPGHDYAVINYDPATQIYTLLNPWGWNTDFSGFPGLLQMTWTDIEMNFYLDGDIVLQHGSPFASKSNLIQMLAGWSDHGDSGLSVHVRSDNARSKSDPDQIAAVDRTGAENAMKTTPVESSGLTDSAKTRLANEVGAEEIDLAPPVASALSKFTRLGAAVRVV
jgi:hypothetical protein